MRRSIVIIAWVLLVVGLIWAGTWILGATGRTNPLSVLLILVAIGILRKKDWARQMLIIWASIILVFSFIRYYIVDLSYSKTFLETLKVFIPIIPCVLILYFFTRKSVKEQFIEKQKSNVEGISFYTKFLITVVNFFLIFLFFSASSYFRLSILILIIYPFLLNFGLNRFIKDRMTRYRFLFRQFLGFWLLFGFAYLGIKSKDTHLYSIIAGYCFILTVIFLISRMFVWIQGKRANVQIKSKIIGDNK